ncbi:hypothetical protein LA6_003438 [Marinibacterium anthonyi]|nr:hypothetical protein LA6_003438 [Marinibacterium anthonyi]
MTERKKLCLMTKNLNCMRRAQRTFLCHLAFGETSSETLQICLRIRPDGALFDHPTFRSVQRNEKLKEASTAGHDLDETALFGHEVRQNQFLGFDGLTHSHGIQCVLSFDTKSCLGLCHCLGSHQLGNQKRNCLRYKSNDHCSTIYALHPELDNRSCRIHFRAPYLAPRVVHIRQTFDSAPRPHSKASEPTTQGFVS